MARARNTDAAATTTGEFTCPECGKTFGRAAALGAHRSRAHGVAGATASRRTRPKRATMGAERGPAATAATSTRKRATSTASAGAGAKAATRRKRATSTGRASGTRTGGGATRSAATRGAGRRVQATSINHDALLQALFPSGIPARESVLSQVNSWLAEAERLAKLA
jgi:hypothetical protein